MIHYRMLETWRLMAALAVMVWHFLRFAPASYEVHSDFLHRFLPMMEMFFMISGFLIMMRYGDGLLRQPGSYRAFILRRFARLYPLFAVTLMFFVGIGGAIHLGLIPSNHPQRYDFAMLPYHIVLIQGWGLNVPLGFNYVAWTLSAEWFCYLTLPVIVLAYRVGGTIGLAALAALSILLLDIACATGFMPFQNWLIADTWGAYRAFADFAIGALIAVLARNVRWTLQSHVPAWTAMILSLVVMQTMENDYVVLALLALAILFGAVAEQRNPDRSDYLKPISPVGKVSFGIYLIHPVVETLFFSGLLRLTGDPTAIIGFYPVAAVPFVLTIVIAMLSARYFEAPVARLIIARYDNPIRKPRQAVPAT